MPERIPPGVEAWAILKLWAGLVLTWLAGASGQTAVAGALGGGVRWWLDEQRKRWSWAALWRGAVSVIVGSIFARYFAPVALTVIEKGIGPLGDGGFATAAFAAGLGGMSIAKIIIALLEGAARKGAPHDNAS